MGHHFDSELARDNPQADLLDIYCFPSPDADRRTTFIVDSAPHAEPGASYAELVGEGLVVKFHVGFDREFSDGFTFTYRLDGDEIVLGRCDSAVVDLADVGEEVARFAPDSVSELRGGCRVFSGVVRDPFFGNSPGMRAFRDEVDAGNFAPEHFDGHHNIFDDRHVISSVLEVPDADLPEQVWCHASSVLYIDDHWHQVNRVATVLLPHLYLRDPQLVTDQNSQPVTSDHTRRDAVIRLVEHFASVAGVQEDPHAYAVSVAERILPDAMPFRPGTAAGYTIAEVNGRALTDDAMDVALSWLTGAEIDDRISVRDRSTSTFPYLVAE